MSRVDKDHMTTLRPASDSKATAATALQEIQMDAVAYAINNAANCGQLSIIYQEPLLKETEDELIAKGYTLRVDGVSATERSTLIIWK